MFFLRIIICLLFPLCFFSCKSYQFKNYDTGTIIDPQLIKAYHQQELYYMDLQEDGTLVDIGSGNGEVDGVYATLRNKVRFVLVDTFKTYKKKLWLKGIFYDIQRTYKSHNQFKIDAFINTQTTIPLETNRYDRVLCRKSFHEFTNIPAMLNEIKRILTKDGTLTIIENKPEKENTIDPHCKNIIPTASQIIAILEKSGFILVQQQELLQPHFNNNVMNLLVFAKK